MPRPRLIAAALTLAILASPITAPAQQPTPRTIILIDPAHGGPDPGARLPNDLLEKNFTLAFAARLRAQLSTSGFAVISTRDSDPIVPFTTDQRAEIANPRHPAACLILHATDSGNGVHIITSALTPTQPADPRAPTRWDAAQATTIPQSLILANEIGLALQRAKLPVILSRASIRPVDNLLCPAVAIEIAPLGTSDGQTAITNATYQQNIVKALANALTRWRTHQLAAAPPATAAGAEK